VIQSLYQMDSQFGDSLSKTIHQIRHPIRFWRFGERQLELCSWFPRDEL
jgi:hypothetical protein